MTMDLSLVRRGTGASGATLDKQTVGNALVVHPASGMTDEAQALALGVAADTEHDLVVVDLPVDSPIALWESVAKVLPRRRRGVRLVIGGRSRETSALAGQWLSERINRTVVAPDGSVIPSAGGALFVHSGRGSGWVKFQPGRPPKWEAKRFPRPAWDSGLTAELTSTSSRGVAEPLPGGLWVRPVGFDQQQRAHRAALVKGLPAQHDTMAIVLGCPGSPPLTLDDAARLWVRLPESVRANARFVQYGPMSVPAGTTLGQALADLLGKEVAFYSGLPVGSAQLLDVRTVLFDGRLGWTTFAREIGYQPRSAQGAPAPMPRLISHRAPIHGLQEIAPAVYWYSPDAVIEVVQSGLLVRSPCEGRDTPAVRAITLDTSVNNLTFDAEGDDSVVRMRTLAEDLLARLDEHTRRMSRVLPATALLAERSRSQAPTKALAEISQGDPAPALAEPRPTEVVVPRAYRPAAELEVEATPEPALLRAEPTITQRLDPGLGLPNALATVNSPITITSARPPLVPPPAELAGTPAPPRSPGGRHAAPAGPEKKAAETPADGKVEAPEALAGSEEEKSQQQNGSAGSAVPVPPAVSPAGGEGPVAEKSGQNTGSAGPTTPSAGFAVAGAGRFAGPAAPVSPAGVEAPAAEESRQRRGSAEPATGSAGSGVAGVGGLAGPAAPVSPAGVDAPMAEKSQQQSGSAEPATPSAGSGVAEGGRFAGPAALVPPLPAPGAEESLQQNGSAGPATPSAGSGVAGGGGFAGPAVLVPQAGVDAPAAEESRQRRGSAEPATPSAGSGVAGGGGFAGPAVLVPQAGVEAPAAEESLQENGSAGPATPSAGSGVAGGGGFAGPGAPVPPAVPQAGAEGPAAEKPGADAKTPSGVADPGAPVPAAVPPAGFAGPAAPIPPAAPPAGMPSLPGGGPVTPPALPPVATPPVGVPPAATPPAGVSPVSSTVEAPKGPEPAESEKPAQPEVVEQPVEPVPSARGEARLQPTPGAEATALLPKRGAEKEREWLRKSLGAEYGLMSNAAARILSQHPGFQGALSTSTAEVLTDAVAVQLYLSVKGAAIDGGLRTGANGPHVPIARCVVAGLSRLPSHRGPATFAANLAQGEWELYRSQKVVTEWGFLNTLTQPTSTLDGDTDVLVWSITARRTKLLEPAQGGVENRVLFVPGTSFKVLELREPAEGLRGLVLLRELTSSEVDETGKVASDRISLDELALVSLRRELEVWAEADGRAPIDEVAAPRFGALPGLV
ncbi:hypothetical protein [Amycolatopsis sp. NPDC051903]|uniref:hypothetical protein n=1 Tax=Amycolatopsis sp. NPDC051903 TaxID=3363936 RepID=UPI00378CBD5E